jgi:hypothetical protein
MRLVLATALLCVLSFPSQARPSPGISTHTHHAKALHRKAAAHNRRTFRRHARHGRYNHHVRGRGGGHVAQAFHSRGLGARPRAWCGWFARHLVGNDPGPQFNLARNWARWGRPSGPGVGVMVVWSHHVGMITGRAPDGRWVVKSGNDGHAVRERPRSIARAIAFRSAG